MNRPEFIVRTATGFFIVALTLCMIILSSWTYVLWLSLIAWGGSHEFLRLKKLPEGSILLYLFPTIITIMVMVFIFYLTVLFQFSPLWMEITITAFVFLVLSIRLYPGELIKSLRIGFITLIYIGFPLASGGLFLCETYDPRYVLIPVFLIWANDVAAYLAGSRWGVHKIAPQISPGKSLEGTLGGVVLTLITGFILSRIWQDIPRSYLLALSISVPCFALAGDLWESKLKRAAGVKDSGRFFPGHGGVLDRYDSFLFVLPVAAAAFYIFVL